MSNEEQSGEDARDRLRQIAEQRRAEREAEARRQELREKVAARQAEQEKQAADQARQQELRNRVAARQAEQQGKAAATAGQRAAETAKQPAAARPAPAARQPAPTSPAAPARPPTRASQGTPVTTARPLPGPPPRQTIAAPAVAAALSPEVKREVDRLHRRFTSAESDAQLGNVYAAIGRIETAFTQLPLEVDALRARGYAHSRQAEAQIDAFRRQWESTRPRVESALTEHVNRLNGDLQLAGQRVRQISSGTPAVITAATTAVDGLESKIRAADQALRGLYDRLSSELQNLTRELNQIKKMLDQLDESPDIHLRTSEGPIAVVKAQWQRDGSEGPEGNLFLTDQRLLFERKEEVVTRRVLGIFKADSEKHQELMLDIAITDIESVTQRQESGGFLGMGRSEFMDLTLGATAPVSRARFLLKEGRSADWISKIKRVQTGDINRDRHEAYLAEVETADSVLFPTQCPSCFAAVPPAPRGARALTCEFCGATINPL
jgi:hypothetical protein